MPRPREFDEQHVLDAAVRTFWEHGYEATSTETLCAATGLGRSSLYNAFAGKRELYVTALDRYMEQRTATLLATLDGEAARGTVRQRIATVLARAVDGDPGDPAGCFVVNATVELDGAPEDDLVRRALHRDRDRRLTALRDAFDAGRRDGSITSTRPSAELAEFVIATIGGIRVAARGGVGRSALEAIARTALDAL